MIQSWSMAMSNMQIAEITCVNAVLYARCCGTITQAAVLHASDCGAYISPTRSHAAQHSPQMASARQLA
jgi:hypothetical protein